MKALFAHRFSHHPWPLILALAPALSAAPLPVWPTAPVEAGDIGDPAFLPVDIHAVFAMPTVEVATSGGFTFYDHGDPTDYEQFMLELVNRTRADPGAEAARLEIDLNQGLAPGTITDTPKQPLGSHRFLIDASRGHSQWMLEANTFSHTGEGGSNPSQRAQAAGYPSGVGENIAWAGTTGSINPASSTQLRHDGLFISPGHRTNICNGSHREIGLGILLGEFYAHDTNWNALMATQKYGGSGLTPWPFVVGAAYYDFNGNGVYDPGEGIGGLEVNVEGGPYFTTTASAGGYTLPRPSSGGWRDVTFSSHSLEETFAIDMTAGVNHKVDLKLSYAPPVLSGPGVPLVGQTNLYAISPVPGATAFDITVLSAEPSPLDGANDLMRMIDGTAASYSALSTSVRFEGSGAYRFAHPTTADQTLEYAEKFRPGPDASLNFWSRLGWATIGQSARVEISDDGGTTWATLFAQAGTGNSGESSFQARSTSLSAYAGKIVRLRFNYRHTGGTFYPQTDGSVGWFVDAIDFNDIATVTMIEETTVDPGLPFEFVPVAEGTVFILTEPRNLARLWPAGPPLEVSASLPVGGYAAWAQTWEATGSLPYGALAMAPMDDFSGDGAANAVAYALGLNPLVSSAHLLPGWVATETGPAFEYMVDTSAAGATVSPELSIDLETWHPPGAAVLGFASADSLFSTEETVQRRRVAFPEGHPSVIHVRVRVDLP